MLKIVTYLKLGKRIKVIVMKLIFLGAPGAGKGTVAKLIYERIGIIQISTGDLFRAAIKNKTALGLEVSAILEKGELVPDELTVSIVKERVKSADCQSGYILDGFPRTIVQAQVWDKAEQVDYIIYFDITDEEVRNRLCSRRICPQCQAIYNILTNKPKIDNRCDHDNSTLMIRPDDSEEAINKRLEVYHKQTKPLLQYYQKSGKLISIDSGVSPEKTFIQIKEKLHL